MPRLGKFGRTHPASTAFAADACWFRVLWIGQQSLWPQVKVWRVPVAALLPHVARHVVQAER